MKKSFVATVLTLCLVAPVVSQSTELNSFEDKLSYSMGFEVGNYFKAIEDVKKDMFTTGIDAAFKGEKPLLTEEEMLAVKKEYEQKIQEKQMALLEEMKAKNLAAGTAYLEENKKKEGVVVTESGLQYEVLKEGTGDKATAEDTVKVEYVGTLVDGKEFDSSAKHGGPAEFEVGKVIKGWSEALTLMNPGTKLRIVVPAELAYGENGNPVIEPNSTLIFDVELLEIVKK